MKKVLLTMACLVASIAMVQAVTVTWTFNSGTTPSTIADGTTSMSGATSFGWTIQLVEYSGGYATTSGGGNILGSTTLGPSPSLPFVFGSLGSNVGDTSANMYVRIIDGAGNWCNLGVNGGSAYYTSAAGGSSVQESFTAEAVNGPITQNTSAQGTWIAIPEPGTIILFGLGGLVIAARKKFRK